MPLAQFQIQRPILAVLLPPSLAAAQTKVHREGHPGDSLSCWLGVLAWGGYMLRSLRDKCLFCRPLTV